jgi:hypothetical protein
LTSRSAIVLVVLASLGVGALSGSAITGQLMAPKQAELDRILATTLSVKERLPLVHEACTRAASIYPPPVIAPLAATQVVTAAETASRAGLAQNPATEKADASPVDWDKIADAEDLISAAAVQGAWTLEHRDRFRELSEGFPLEQRLRLIREIGRLINEGKVKPDHVGVPF